jgi:hypothetical protein
MVHTCKVSAGTVFFANMIDTGIPPQSEGIAHTIFVKDDRYFELTVMLRGVTGYSLLRAAKTWQISWIGASGAGTGRLTKHEWKQVPGVDLSLGMQGIDLFTKTINTQHAHFMTTPLYFVSLESSGQGENRIMGGNSVVQAASRTSFTVLTKISQCEADGDCTAPDDSKQYRDIGVSVAWMGIQDSNTADFHIGSASDWLHKRGSNNAFTQIKASMNADTHFIASIEIRDQSTITKPLATELVGNLYVRDVSDRGFSMYLAKWTASGMKSLSNAGTRVNWLVYYPNGAPSVTSGTPPVISLNGKGTINDRVHPTSSYVDAGATCSDSKEGQINSNLRTDARKVLLGRPGRYTVYFTCRNGAGLNAVPLTRMVIVHSFATYKMHLEILHMKKEDKERAAKDTNLVHAVCLDAVRDTFGCSILLTQKECQNCITKNEKGLRAVGCSDKLLIMATQSCDNTRTALPTASPTVTPTVLPTFAPTLVPTSTPTMQPTTSAPTMQSTMSPSEIWACRSVLKRTCGKLAQNGEVSGCMKVAAETKSVRIAGCTDSMISDFCLTTKAPSGTPTLSPTTAPSAVPTIYPTAQPTSSPTRMPTSPPSHAPTSKLEVLEQELVCTSALEHACTGTVGNDCMGCANASKLLLEAASCTPKIEHQWCSLTHAVTPSPTDAPSFAPTSTPTKHKFNPIVEAETKDKQQLDSFVQELVNTVGHKSMKSSVLRSKWKASSTNQTTRLDVLAKELGKEIRDKTTFPTAAPTTFAPTLRPTVPPTNPIPGALSSSKERALGGRATKQRPGQQTSPNLSTILGVALMCCLFIIASFAKQSTATIAFRSTHEETTKLINEVVNSQDREDPPNALKSVDIVEEIKEPPLETEESEPSKLKWGDQVQGLRAELTGSKSERMDTKDEVLSGLVLEIMEDIFTNAETWISATEIYSGDALLVRLKKSMRKAASAGLVLKVTTTTENEASVKEALACSFSALQRTMRSNNVYEGADVLSKLRAALTEGAEQVVEVVDSNFLGADGEDAGGGAFDRDRGETALRI